MPDTVSASGRPREVFDSAMPNKEGGDSLLLRLAILAHRMQV